MSGTPTRDRQKPPLAKPGIDPRIHRRRAEVRRRVGRRRLVVVLVVLTVIALVVGSLVVLHSSLLAARRVVVIGDHSETPTASIVSAAGVSAQTPLIDVDAGAIAARVAALPFVRTARVVRSWPDTLNIVVTQRRAVAVMATGEGLWAELDAAGRVLARRSDAKAGLVPLVVDDRSGTVVPPAVGQSLAPLADAGLIVAGSLPRAFSGQVVSVVVEADGTVELVLGSGLTVLLGTDSELRAKYEDIASIIANGPLHGAKTIDVSVPAAPTVSSAAPAVSGP